MPLDRVQPRGGELINHRRRHSIGQVRLIHAIKPEIVFSLPDHLLPCATEDLAHVGVAAAKHPIDRMKEQLHRASVVLNQTGKLLDPKPEIRV
jgi:hypothetical protein